jgi:predicted Rossmann fold nucleotide-binding protein DprA/Smf involved in DNA uptake
MRWSAFTAAAVALAAMASAAQAEEVTGRISGLDDTAHRITLSDGRTYALAAMSGAAYSPASTTTCMSARRCGCRRMAASSPA